MSELTVKEYAAHERVHESTVRRWIDKGAVPIRRTPGGGIRVVTIGRAESSPQVLSSSRTSTHPST